MEHFTTTWLSERMYWQLICAVTFGKRPCLLSQLQPKCLL